MKSFISAASSTAAKVGDLLARAPSRASGSRCSSSGSRCSEVDEAEGAFDAARRPYEPSIFSSARHTWARREMIARKPEYTVRRPLSICVSSWNVAGKRPPPFAELDSESDWLQLAESADVYAVGLQEVVDLTAQNLSAGAGNTLSASASLWEASISARLFHGRAGGAYVLLARKQLVGLLLLVFVKAEHAAFARAAATSAGTGVLGLLGNKGAVAVSLQASLTLLPFASLGLSHSQVSDSPIRKSHTLPFASLRLSHASQMSHSPMFSLDTTRSSFLSI